MRRLAFATSMFLLSYLFSMVSAASAETVQNVLQTPDEFLRVCRRIEKSVSPASSIHYPGWGSRYANHMDHWASSSSARAACSVEPGTAEDVATILGVVAETSTPFAVKGGGHATNPGWSSTSGVHISMTRFNNVTYDPTTHTADVGAGLVWDEVYAALEPYGVNVIGGRVIGVGVAGFTLGGGYSWKTNQYGLAVDNVKAYELVLANGTVASVTEDSMPDLFWGLKGGMNNFGIVTKLTLKTYPQTHVWGGMIMFTGRALDAVNKAVVKFAQTVTDPRAAVLPTFNYFLGQSGVTLFLFYDYPIPPPGIFEDFLSIPSFTKNVKTRTFLDLINVAPSNAFKGTRGVIHSISLKEYTPAIMDAVVNETKFWGKRLSWRSAIFVSYDVEPFLQSLFTHADEGSSAYPPTRATGVLPLHMFYAWVLGSADDTMYAAARQSAAHLTRVAISDGQDVADAPLYGNYAMFDTPVERIFGGNTEKMREIKKRYDPENVMGLAGGWKL